MSIENKPWFVGGVDQSPPWAILPEELPRAVEAVTRAMAMEMVTPQAAQLEAAAAQRPAPISGGIAVIPISGTIYARGGGLFFELFGLTSAESIARKVQAALNDGSVGAIVLDVNSPGGSVQGVEELSRMIYDARGTKPIVAVANHLAASAAYWIATAADQLLVTPSGEVGSVGVFAAHSDYSQAMTAAGVKTTLISAGKYKVEGNPYQPLTEEAAAAIQSRVNDYYNLFTSAIARNRQTPVADVRAGYGEGRAVGAKEALALGMVDGISTIDQAIEQLGKRQAKAPRMSGSAELEIRQRRARALGGI